MLCPLERPTMRSAKKVCGSANSGGFAQQSDTSLHELGGYEKSVQDKVVLITGAGQRLGAAMAKRLMSEGWHVLIHVRSSVDQAKALLEEA